MPIARMIFLFKKESLLFPPQAPDERISLFLKLKSPSGSVAPQRNPISPLCGTIGQVNVGRVFTTQSVKPAISRRATDVD